MCGLVGVAGDLYGRDCDVFQQLLYADGLRGFHSTGAAMCALGGRDMTLVKQVGGPWNLLREKTFKEELRPSKSVLIGHNRFATVGEHTIENAHPFAFDHIVGAHNGTLLSWTRKKLVDEEKFGTDSEALYCNIDAFGLKETMANVDGAWALTFYDSDDNTINFLRNKERPLSYCFNKARDVIYWASEPEMLKWVLARNNVERTEVVHLNPNVWVKFAVPNSRQRFGEPVLEEVKGYEPRPFRGRVVWDSTEPWEVDGTGLGQMDWMKPKEPLLIGPGTHQNENSADKTASGSSKKNSPAKQRSGSDEKHGSLQETRHIGQSGRSQSIDDNREALDKAFEDGVTAGERAWSKSRNPFPAKSRRAQEWLDGRNFGLQSAISSKQKADERIRKASSPKSAADVPVTKPPQGVEIIDSDTGPRVKAYGAEWIDEEEFLKRTQGFCHWGGHNVEFTDKLHWLNRTDCACDDCVSGNKLLQEIMKAA